MTVGELEITPTRNHKNYVTLNPISYIFVLLAGFTLNMLLVSSTPILWSDNLSDEPVNEDKSS